MNICKKCGKEFEPSKGLINYCSLNCRNGHKHSNETKRKISIATKRHFDNGLNTTPIGKSLFGPDHPTWVERKTTICEYCGISFVQRITENRKYHAHCAKKCSGGHREGSGRGKKGWYKDYFCDSSWELAWVLYNIDHNISFSRNKKAFTYIFNNKKRLYYPDFILEDGTFVEIKGYESEQFKEKIKQFPHNIRILLRKDIEPIIDEYIIPKYGKNFIELYDGNPHNKLTKICPICGKSMKETNVYCSRICSGKGVKQFGKT